MILKKRRRRNLPSFDAAGYCVEKKAGSGGCHEAARCVKPLHRVYEEMSLLPMVASNGGHSLGSFSELSAASG